MRPLKLVAIGDPAAPHLRRLEQLLSGVEIAISDQASELRTLLGEADVVLHDGFHGALFRDVFPLASKAQWVHNLSTGVEDALSPEVIASPIPLTNGRGVFSDVLAEFVAGAVLYFAKDFRRMIRNQMAGKWSQFDVLPVRGATLAIVGYGDIGRKSAKLAGALGMRITALRRRAWVGREDPPREDPPGEDPPLGAAYAPDCLREMLAGCDYLLVSAPLTPETRGMIGEAELAALKPGAVVINIGRGPVIVEAALVRALEENRIKGAALDVFDREPLPAGHPFYRLENVLLSPHCADHVAGWIGLSMEKFIANFRHFEAGEPLENVVDKRAGY